MIPANVLAALANHLWQSTLFAAAVGLLTLALKKNHAQARHWLWLTASAKFLIPFSLLVAIGGNLGWRTAPAPPLAGFTSPSFTAVIQEISQPFSPPQPHLVFRTHSRPTFPIVSTVILGAWFCGFAAVLLAWLVSWRRITAAVRQAVPLAEGRERNALRRLQRISGIGYRIQLLASTARLEPGVFGIRRPILLLPSGIADRLEDQQLEAIIAHELCHVRRRDNLASAFHMLVQAIFWFHPLVWWLGAKLVDERERACDEDVLRLGNPPQVYAEGILKVCEFYLESPLVCVAGVSGANLKKRIEEIMNHRTTNKLEFGRKLLLATIGAAAVAGPILIGLLNTPQSRAQSAAAPSLRASTAAASSAATPSGVCAPLIERNVGRAR
jgi:beta-lactamase regulating signal transducer with metallopeptidase domain